MPTSPSPTPVLQILKRARELVAPGFVTEREDYSAEDKKGHLVQYTDESAVRFSPSAAIWRAEHEILPTVRDERERHRLQGLALKHLTTCAPDKFTEQYRKAGEIGSVLEWFDEAIRKPVRVSVPAASGT